MTIIKNGCICGGDYYTTTEQCNHTECKSERKDKTETKSLLNKQEKLYAELTATFDDKNQFKLLNELLETEIEIEGLCNQ